jgi:hypothetical protein
MGDPSKAIKIKFKRENRRFILIKSVRERNETSPMMLRISVTKLQQECVDLISL